jgi:hypothetical protein
MKRLLWIVTALSAVLASAPSHAFTVDFSIVNTLGNVPGIVTGQIILPSANGTGEAASEVFIDTAPSTIITDASISLPFNILSAPEGPYSNLFNVSGGQITSVAFNPFDATSGGNLGLYFNTSGTDELVLEGGPYYEIVQASFVTFSAAPLPSTWTMLIVGFVGLGFIAYRGTKKATAALSAA